MGRKAGKICECRGNVVILSATIKQVIKNDKQGQHTGQASPEYA